MNEQQNYAPRQKPKYLFLWIFLICGIVAIAAAIVLGVLYYKDHQKLKNATINTDQSAQLVTQVGKLMVLPQDEQPSIATVQDLSKLQDQPFFANALVGDKVLIYTKAKKAVLFRPSTNKIIEVAPLNDGVQSGSNSQ